MLSIFQNITFFLQCKDLSLCIICFSVVDKKSFDSVEEHLRTVKKECKDQNVLFFVIGKINISYEKRVNHRKVSRFKILKLTRILAIKVNKNWLGHLDRHDFWQKLSWTFWSTEIEEKRVNENGLGHLGWMAKNAQNSFMLTKLCWLYYPLYCVDLKLALSTIIFVKHYTCVKLERANLRLTQKEEIRSTLLCGQKWPALTFCWSSCLQFLLT